VVNNNCVDSCLCQNTYEILKNRQICIENIEMIDITNDKKWRQHFTKFYEASENRWGKSLKLILSPTKV
jgi:hypothetical protein